MEIYKMLFATGSVLCLIAMVLLMSIQLGMATKHGVYGSTFKNLNQKQIKRAKTSGYIFVLGVVVIVLGMVTRNAL